MSQLMDTHPLKVHLIKMLHFFEIEHPMEEPEIVLILISLNTEEKILKFMEWVDSKYDGESFLLDKHQIIGAAVRINHGETNLP